MRLTVLLRNGELFYCRLDSDAVGAFLLSLRGAFGEERCIRMGPTEK